LRAHFGTPVMFCCVAAERGVRSNCIVRDLSTEFLGGVDSSLGYGDFLNPTSSSSSSSAADVEGAALRRQVALAVLQLVVTSARYPRASLACQPSRRSPKNGIILSQKVGHFSGGIPDRSC
jgi:hypothetical protein